MISKITGIFVAALALGLGCCVGANPPARWLASARRELDNQDTRISATGRFG